MPDVKHRHRKPKKRDFQGKTVKRFLRRADNIWQFEFTDGTAFAIQSELHCGFPIMEVCNVCHLIPE